MTDHRPWYKQTLRWGQTNITEQDAIRYDIAWWREHWRNTRVQGVIINAGGIVAYYPSSYELHYRAEHLGERDLYGELVAAAREDGLTVLARMDSNRATEAFYQRHPDWFAHDKEGKPYRARERYIACVSSDYYEDFLPAILREIIERSHPEGFTDNSWSGLGRNQICYCDNCRRRFREHSDAELPEAVRWDDPVYRRWIRWNYDRRLEIWDLNNRVTQSHGGADCLWLGMISGNMMHQAHRLRDTKAMCERSEIVMLDYQHRPKEGFQGNSHAGKLLHGLVGWDKLIPESMPMYQGTGPTFRVASKPAPEARMWMVEGFAGTIQPWWHHISAYHEDRRQYRTAAPVMAWYEQNEEYLFNREPIASVGVIWSQENIDFYGQDHDEERVMLPYWGVIQALIRARIPYIPVHADHIGRDAHRLDVLILPAMGALSDCQCEHIRDFVARGGGLLASGVSSLYDEWGVRRPDFALADLFGAHATGKQSGSTGGAQQNWEEYEKHTYLRIHPELRRQVYGPQTGNEPEIVGERHPSFRGFEETDILPFGGQLEQIQVDGHVTVPLTYIPPFPIYPPEFAWMREPDSGESALVLNVVEGGGRIAYLAADLDRCFGRDNLPDHGDLLANLVRWVAHDRLPLAVTGPGLIDCNLYRQDNQLILHLVNLTSAGTWRSPVHELIAVGPLTVKVRVPEGVAGQSVQHLVAGDRAELTAADGWVQFEVPSIKDHEVVVLR
jgi:hypothetical protein